MLGMVCGKRNLVIVNLVLMSGRGDSLIVESNFDIGVVFVPIVSPLPLINYTHRSYGMDLLHVCECVAAARQSRQLRPGESLQCILDLNARSLPLHATVSHQVSRFVAPCQVAMLT